MPCLTCDQQKDKAYNDMLKRKLSAFFLSNPCIDCGENDVVVLDFTGSNQVWEAVKEKTPWPLINRMLQQAKVRCGNCERRHLGESVGTWGLRS